MREQEFEFRSAAARNRTFCPPIVSSVMAQFVEWDKSSKCVVRFIEKSECDAETETGVSLRSSSFLVALRSDVRLYETPVFELKGTDLKVKLLIRKASNVHNRYITILLKYAYLIQFVLVEPLDDVFEIQVNGKEGFLTSESDSFTCCDDPKNLWSTSSKQSLLFPMEVLNFMLPWKSEFNVIEPAGIKEPVILSVGEKQVRIEKYLLTSKSAVFKSIIADEHFDGLIEVTGFPFEVVQEMVRFLVHGYCSGWKKYGKDLHGIASHFQIKDMVKLAKEKKKLLKKMQGEGVIFEPIII
jgi:hypothetical protein